MDRRRTILFVGLVALLISLPYAFAALQSNEQNTFGGFLVNPQDGYSYLAKMVQGWEGNWLFTLPYTAQPGEGAFLFTFYLFLGQVARWAGLPLIWVYHMARMFASVFMLLALITFFRESIFPANPRAVRLAVVLAALGSGLGWLAVLGGGMTADLWVAEAYPFLSAYTNPHFPLGIGLIVTIFRIVLMAFSWKRAAQLFIIGILLSVVMPFGLVVVGMVCGVKFVWDSFETRSVRPWSYIALFSGGLPILVYQYAITLSHPVLSVWNSQNLTPSPALWDFVVSFSPALILSVIGIRAGWFARQQPGMRLLLIWFVLGALLAYVPFTLQRRFLTAYFVPSAGMAIAGIQQLRRGSQLRWLVPVMLASSMLTNTMVLIAGVFGASAQALELYQSSDDQAAFAWIRAKTPEDALILTGPETGLYVPALTGRRVLYGHPFETANAEEQEALVQGFFSGETASMELSAKQAINYILVGPRERKYGNISPPQGFVSVFQQGDTTIYQREPIP